MHRKRFTKKGRLRSALLLRHGGIEADRLMADLRLPGSSRKKGRQVKPAVGKTAGAHKAAVSLDTLHPDTPPGMLFETPSEKIDRGEGGLLRVSRQNAQTCELVHGSILKQAQTRGNDTVPQHLFHIHLDPLSWRCHLLAGACSVPPLCAGLDGYGAAGTGGSKTAPFHPGFP